MNVIAAGPTGLGDWVDIIIVVLIVGGSALGGITKALIKKFSPKPPAEPPLAEKKRPHRAPEWKTARPLPPRARGVPPPSRPVARPYPPKSPRPSPHPVPVPGAVPDLLAELIPELVPVPKPDSPRSPPRNAPPRSERFERHVAPARGKSASPPRRARPTTEERLGHLTSNLDHAEDRLSHLETSVDPSPGELKPSRVEARQIPRSDKIATDPGDLMSRPTRSVLRRAIVLSEILAPPMALRAPDDSGPGFVQYRVS